MIGHCPNCDFVWTEPDPLAVGDLLEGYCGGWFGRDWYGTKHVEAIGSDWVVARENGVALVAHCSPAELVEYRVAP